MGTFTSFPWVTLVILLLWPTVGASSGNKVQLFFDDFNIDADDVDRTVWQSPDGNAGCFGRTVIRKSGSTPGSRSKIQVYAGTAKLVLSTFNPVILGAGRSFWGSEIDSIRHFSLPNNRDGIEFSARIRWPSHLPEGIVTALFAYGLIRGSDCDFKDEIDFELPSNHLQASSKSPKVLLNWYKDQPPGVGRPQLIETPNIDLTRFNELTIRWFSDRIEWYINNQMIHKATGDIPIGPMSVRVNIWVPSAGFSQAFSPTIQPVSNPDQNSDYLCEIDWVKVNRIQAD